MTILSYWDMDEQVLIAPVSGFSFTPGLGKRLRELRKKAGLSQAEVARRMGRTGRQAFSIVSRLESGRTKQPTIGLVVDFLTACGASLSDIEDLAPSGPLVSLNKKRARKPKSREEKLRLVRKRAETLPLETVLEDRLFEWLDDEDLLPLLEQRKALAGFGRTVFHALLKARKATLAAKKKLLATGPGEHRRCGRGARSDEAAFRGDGQGRGPGPKGAGRCRSSGGWKDEAQ
jgi:transcriptional regulator with XRE-family HTH domain